MRKGEKALMLCMPVTCKAKHPARDQQGQETQEEIAFTRFVYRNQWFVLNQTEGAEYQPGVSLFAPAGSGSPSRRSRLPADSTSPLIRRTAHESLRATNATFAG